MVVQGFPRLTSKFKSNRGATFDRLPDEMIIAILSKLPVDCLPKCGRVCRLWRKLVSSHDLATLHHDRGRPITFILHRHWHPPNDPGLFILEDNKRKKVLKRLYIRSTHKLWKYSRYDRFFHHSCLGLLLFSAFRAKEFFVLNPMTQEEITITYTHNSLTLCGLFYCPLTRDFKLLCVEIQGYYRGKIREGLHCQYVIYSCKTRAWRKIRSPSLNFFPRYASPSILNGVMHWIVNRYYENEQDIPPCSDTILTFRIDNEELSIMPHPGIRCNSKDDCRSHQTMSLLVMNEWLSFCQSLIRKKVIDIWILKDYEMWAWIKIYRVDLNFVPYYVKPLNRGRSYYARAVSFQDGELVIRWYEKGLLYLYNLEKHKGRMIELPGDVASFYRYGSYTKSMFSIV